MRERTGERDLTYAWRRRTTAWRRTVEDYHGGEPPEEFFFCYRSERDGSIKNNMVSSHVTHKPLLHPDPKEDLYNFSSMKLEDSSDNVASKSGKIGYIERKAFTGSVIEHTHDLQSDQPAKSTSTNQPTKPVSRFKMMKGNH